MLDKTKKVLITGGADGIGLSIALKMLNMGVQVTVFDSDEEKIKKMKEVAEHLPLIAHCVDIRDIERVTFIYGQLDSDAKADILINAVGGDANSKELEELDQQYLEQLLNHNLVTVFNMTKLCVPEMKKRKWGRVVNFTSIAGRTYSYFSNAAYVAAKAGVIGFTKQIAYELASCSITVNAVAHGPIATSRILNAWEQKSELKKKAILDKIPIGRLGTVEEAAEIVLYLCSPNSGFTTGAVFDINGGLYI